MRSATSTTPFISGTWNKLGSNGCIRSRSARAGKRTLAVVVNASCNFKVPLVYPADVEVRMYLGDPGRTSIGSYYDLSVAGQRCADGAARMVWTDRETGKPVPLPKAVVAPLRAAAD